MEDEKKMTDQSCKLPDKDRITEEEILDLSDLEKIAGGAGNNNEKKYFIIEGDSYLYGGHVKVYVRTYDQAVRLCRTLNLSPDCIKEVDNTN